MTTVPMITELTNAGWTNGTTITTVNIDESHGYNYADCSQESNGSWMCFVGYADEDNEEEIATLLLYAIRGAEFRRILNLQQFKSR